MRFAIRGDLEVKTSAKLLRYANLWNRSWQIYEVEPERPYIFAVADPQEPYLEVFELKCRQGVRDYERYEDWLCLDGKSFVKTLLWSRFMVRRVFDIIEV